jgi:hypothetical protein
MNAYADMFDEFDDFDAYDEFDEFDEFDDFDAYDEFDEDEFLGDAWRWLTKKGSTQRRVALGAAKNAIVGAGGGLGGLLGGLAGPAGTVAGSAGGSMLGGALAGGATGDTTAAYRRTRRQPRRAAVNQGSEQCGTHTAPQPSDATNDSPAAQYCAQHHARRSAQVRPHRRHFWKRRRKNFGETYLSRLSQTQTRETSAHARPSTAPTRTTRRAPGTHSQWLLPLLYAQVIFLFDWVVA